MFHVLFEGGREWHIQHKDSGTDEITADWQALESVDTRTWRNHLLASHHLLPEGERERERPKVRGTEPPCACEIRMLVSMMVPCHSQGTMCDVLMVQQAGEPQTPPLGSAGRRLKVHALSCTAINKKHNIVHA